MSKWDSSCTNLGSTVKRLQSLRGLHEQGLIISTFFLIVVLYYYYSLQRLNSLRDFLSWLESRMNWRRQPTLRGKPYIVSVFRVREVGLDDITVVYHFTSLISVVSLRRKISRIS